MLEEERNKREELQVAFFGILVLYKTFSETPRERGRRNDETT